MAKDQPHGFYKVWDPKITGYEYGEQDKQKESTLVIGKKCMFIPLENCQGNIISETDTQLKLMLKGAR